MTKEQAILRFKSACMQFGNAVLEPSEVMSGFRIDIMQVRTETCVMIANRPYKEVNGRIILYNRCNLSALFMAIEDLSAALKGELPVQYDITESEYEEMLDIFLKDFAEDYRDSYPKYTN